MIIKYNTSKHNVKSLKHFCRNHV